ncbi:MAG: pilus assembly protein [Myxococcaceae bacterium]|nr:pilus assembly protein [Myxococcaceae bacterium]
MMRTQARGQSTVEFALGSLALITVLTVGVHLAEVGYLELKTTEAANAAIWDTTAKELHEWPGNVSPARASITSSAADVQARYQDFDGRQSAIGQPTLTKMFTTASRMRVTCQSGQAPAFSPAYHTSGAYSDNGGIGCTASAELNSINVPQQFYDDTFFREANDTGRPITACAMGRNWNGAGCRGQFVTLLDDWGLSGRSESMPCPMFQDVPAPCLNLPYWQMGFSVFTRNGMGMGVAGSSLAMNTVQRMPFPFFFGGENFYWMSAMGEDSLPPFVQIPRLASMGDKTWTTTPGGEPGSGTSGLPYVGSFILRTAKGNCFLGKGGC